MKKLFIFLLMGLFLVSLASSFEFDNLDIESKDSKLVEIKNLFGLGGRIADITLLTPLNFKVARGYNKVAEFNLIGHTEYKTFLSNMEFFDLKKGEKRINRQYDFKVQSFKEVEVEDWDWKDTTQKLKNGTIVREYVKVGTHKVKKEVWTEIEYLKINNETNITIGIFTDVKEGDKVDWIPTFAGVRVAKWATWTESLNAGMGIYQQLNNDLGNNGTLGDVFTEKGTIQYQTGQVNNAYDPDSGNNYKIDDIAFTDFSTNDFTWAFWYKWSNPSGNCKMIWEGTVSPDWIVLFDKTGDNIKILVGGSPILAYANTTQADGNWHHVVWRRTGSNNQLMVDGISRANASNSANYNSATIDIGQYQGGLEPCEGIDELGVWNRSVTNSEVVVLANNGTYEGGSSATAPTVTLISPTEGQNLTSTTATFTANATDAVEISNVTLYIDGVLNETNSSEVNGTYVFSKVLSTGLHNWSISATNNNSLQTNSSTTDFHIAYVNVTLDKPSNASNINKGDVNFNASAVGYYNLENVSLYTDDGGWSIKNTSYGVGIKNRLIEENLTSIPITDYYTWELVKTFDINDYVNIVTSSKTTNLSGFVTNVSFVYVDSSTKNVSLDTSEYHINFTNPDESKLVDVVNIYVSNNLAQPENISNNSLFGWNASTSANKTFTLDIQETTIWNMEYCDINGFCQFADENFTAVADEVAPSLNITAPLPVVDYGKEGINLSLNWSVSDDNLDSCKYNYNGTNVTVACGDNTTIFTLEAGNDNLTMYAIDIGGNEASNFTSWDYKVFENSRIYDLAVLSGVPGDLTINLTANATLANVTLNYSGDIYASSMSGQSYTSSVTPEVSGVNTFNWIFLYDGANITSTSSSQLVADEAIDNCTIYTNQIFNFTMFDESSLDSIYGNIEVDLQTLSPTFTVLSNLPFQFTNVTNASICSNNTVENFSYYYNLDIRYYKPSTDGFSFENVPELYHVQRGSPASLPLSVPLYDLNSNQSTEFKVTYQDSSFNFVEDAIIQLQRKYISEGLYRTVEAPLTSDEGTAILHVNLDAIKYRATVTKNGVVLDEFDNLVFNCQSELTGECEKKLLGQIDPGNDVNLDITRDFVYSEPVLNDTTHEIEVSYSIPSSTPATVLITLEQKDEFGEKILCNKTIVSSSGAIFCNFTDALTRSYIDFTIYKNGEVIGLKSYVVDADSNLDWLGNNYIFLVIIIFSLVGMAMSSPEWIIINGIVTMVLAGALFLVNGLNFVVGLGSIIWLVIAGIILISKISKQEDR